MSQTADREFQNCVRNFIIKIFNINMYWGAVYINKSENNSTEPIDKVLKQNLVIKQTSDYYIALKNADFS